MKVLVVEDNDANRELFVESLNGEPHYKAIGVSSAEEAMDLCKADSFDLIMLDMMLPGRNGLEFCRWLRQQPGGQKPFVMVVTGRTSEDDIGEIFASGANDYLAKPLTIDVLFARLSTMRS
jgi:DNA-binding response OmpR family regulator